MVSPPASRFPSCLGSCSDFDDEQWCVSISWMNSFLPCVVFAHVSHHSNRNPDFKSVGGMVFDSWRGHTRQQQLNISAGLRCLRSAGHSTGKNFCSWEWRVQPRTDLSALFRMSERAEERTGAEGSSSGKAGNSSGVQSRPKDHWIPLMSVFWELTSLWCRRLCNPLPPWHGIKCTQGPDHYLTHAPGVNDRATFLLSISLKKGIFTLWDMEWAGLRVSPCRETIPLIEPSHESLLPWLNRETGKTQRLHKEYSQSPQNP